MIFHQAIKNISSFSFVHELFHGKQNQSCIHEISLEKCSSEQMLELVSIAFDIFSSV